VRVRVACGSCIAVVWAAWRRPSCRQAHHLVNDDSTRNPEVCNRPRKQWDAQRRFLLSLLYAVLRRRGVSPSVITVQTVHLKVSRGNATPGGQGSAPWSSSVRSHLAAGGQAASGDSRRSGSSTGRRDSGRARPEALSRARKAQPQAGCDAAHAVVLWPPSRCMTCCVGRCRPRIKLGASPPVIVHSGLGLPSVAVAARCQRIFKELCAKTQANASK